MDKEKTFVAVIAASWSFDVGHRNNLIIGIREVYIKQDKGGNIEEIINTRKNASCRCKMVIWHQQRDGVETFYLRNQLLDLLPIENLQNLIDEKSIIVRVPQEKLILSTDNTCTQKQSLIFIGP